MRRYVHWTLAVLVLGASLPAHAQISTGSLYGTVEDESGAVLPGSLVSLSSDFGSRSTVAGPDGGFRFLNLDHGRYELSVSLSDFGTVKRNHIAEAGASATVTIQLSIAELAEVIEVTATTPVIDPKKMGSITTLSRDELDRVPQARDPWDLVKSAPGVIIARVNIAGAENDQQTSFTAKGAVQFDTTYSIDGLQVDDFAASGNSPTYWDYGAFDEITFTTGGNSLNIQTGSLGFNFVTKRGTNRWRGTARGLLTHDDLGWGNVAGSELENDPRLELPDGGFSDKADHIRQIHEYGLDIGGPLIQDKLFVWGSYGRQDIRKVRKDQTTQKAVLHGFNGKLSWTVSNSTHASVFYSNTRKTVDGRQPFGNAFTYEDRSLIDQGPLYSGSMPLDIHGLLKFEVNHVVNPDLILNIKYANWDTGFGFKRRDATTNSTVDFFAAEVRGGGVRATEIRRPLKHVTDVTGSYFAEGWGGSHELKFGFGYKRHEASSISTYGSTGEQLVGANFGPGFGYAWVNRDGAVAFKSDIWHAYVGDTFTKDRLTVAAGLRFDRQSASNVASSIPANPAFPDLLPAIEYGGGGTGISWSNVSPRGGLTYALQEDRQSLVRLSFASYAGKLGTIATTLDNPVQGAYQAYFWNDLNSDGLITADEVDLASGLQYWGGHDPSDPTALDTPNEIDPGYSANRDYEVILGLDHELLPDLAIGAAYTWRRTNNLPAWQPRLRAGGGIYGPGDYIENDPVEANGFTANSFSPDPRFLGAGGRLLTNRPDYHRSFGGLDLTLRKRLSNGWMARAAISYMNHREYIDGPGAIGNPTRTVRSDLTSSGPQVDGGQFGVQSSVAGKGSRVRNAKWQFNANALYELPRGFDISASLFGRQGFAYPVQIRARSGADGRIRALAVPTIDSERLPTFWNLDLRLGKVIRLRGVRSLTAAVEMFNVFNSNTVLARNPEATSRAFGLVEEIPQPRILRLSAKLSF